MIPWLLLLAGVLCLGAGLAVLASFGTGLRLGRLLATTPALPIGELVGLATEPRPRYVRVGGRIDSEELFEDVARRPLVLRRTRVQVRQSGRWRTVEDSLEVVPFQLQDGLDAVSLDGAALGDGLVVVPRLSTGHVADLGERAPAGASPAAPARIRIDQLSAVEHATALGVPSLTADGQVRLVGTRRRPLVLTTLEDAEAMRILANGGQHRARLVVGLIGAGALLVVAGLVMGFLSGIAS